MTGTAGVFSAAADDGVDVTVTTGNDVFVQTTTGTGVYGVTHLRGGNGVEGVNHAAVTGKAGVFGTANSTSVTPGGYRIYSGVWGDTGDSSTQVPDLTTACSLPSGPAPRMGLADLVAAAT
jgi:hypothetical protein